MKIKTLSLVMVLMLISMPFQALAQQTGDAAQASAQTNDLVWVSVGVLCGVFSIPIAYLAEPPVPAMKIVGKSPEYVAYYADTYKQRVRYQKTSAAAGRRNLMTEQQMTEQQWLGYISRHEKAGELTQLGIEQFNKGKLEEALSLFEESNEINPNAIPNLLYDALCRFSILQRKTRNSLNPMLIAHPDQQSDVQDIISKLELVLAGLKFIKF